MTDTPRVAPLGVDHARIAAAYRLDGAAVIVGTAETGAGPTTVALPGGTLTLWGAPGLVRAVLALDLTAAPLAVQHGTLATFVTHLLPTWPTASDWIMAEAQALLRRPGSPATWDQDRIRLQVAVDRTPPTVTITVVGLPDPTLQRGRTGRRA